ncbi:hypothetical protein SR858_14750 [Duganella zoogloeoides]|uniref:DUF2752 domain-containing protein n=1 Tax=Duganella zoogloeoides TaxID=75659 RepID=A0ABZ0XRI8_9BURK|nr:hypothetical protein [Duganella zoogloeoides]WQH02338.1 hypothetical protein SR858_14750 [Duganella zoogloeoides]
MTRMEALARKLASHLTSFGLASLLAATLTYISLAVPGRVSAVCANVGTPIYCPVLAYGFPLPFLADNQGISPVGSVARDPLSVLIGEDDILWGRLAINALFWMLVSIAARLLWLRRRRNHAPDSKNELSVP